MKFGPVPVGQAEGTILAHSTVAGARRYRKAHLLTAEDVEILRQAGFEEVIVAVLDGDDIEENEAAARIAERLGFAGATARPPATGRVNIFADTDGIFTVDRALVELQRTG